MLIVDINIGELYHSAQVKIKNVNNSNLETRTSTNYELTRTRHFQRYSNATLDWNGLMLMLVITDRELTNENDFGEENIPLVETYFWNSWIKAPEVQP